MTVVALGCCSRAITVLHWYVVFFTSLGCSLIPGPRMSHEEMDVDLFGAHAPADDSTSRQLPGGDSVFILPPPMMFAELMRERISAPELNNEVIVLEGGENLTTHDPSPVESHTSNALQMLQGALEQLRQAAELNSSTHQTRTRRRSTRRQQRGGSQRTSGTR